MFKEYIMRKMLEKQMGNVPAEEREKLIALVTKNPELFQKIALEMQERIKNGEDQMQAAMTVMQAHKEELQKLVTRN